MADMFSSRERIETATQFFGRCIPVTETGCWLWTGSTTTDGYGSLRFDGKWSMAHRLAYALEKGEIPVGMLVCHKCDVPLCCNPDHLFAGTHKDNIQDCVRKGRIATGERLGQYTKPESVPRGDKHYAMKIPAACKGQIRQRVAAGEKQSRIADEFGVSATTINYIIKGRVRKPCRTN